MIVLNEKICQELGLTYWQLSASEQGTKPAVIQHTINHEEKELLRKILLAKDITLTDEMLVIEEQGVVVVTINKRRLIFNNVTLKDTDTEVNLAKLSAMLSDKEQKKFTWYKLKQLNFYH